MQMKRNDGKKDGRIMANRKKNRARNYARSVLSIDPADIMAAAAFDLKMWREAAARVTERPKKKA